MSSTGVEALFEDVLGDIEEALSSLEDARDYHLDGENSNRNKVLHKAALHIKQALIKKNTNNNEEPSHGVQVQDLLRGEDIPE